MIDVLCLAMYQLSIYYSNEILLGFANKGEYKLKPEYIDSKIDAKYIITREVREPTEIIKELIQNPGDFLKLAGIASQNTSESNSQVSSRTESESNSLSSTFELNSGASSRTTSGSNELSENESKTISKTTSAPTIVPCDEQNTDKEYDIDDVFDTENTDSVKPLFKLPNYHNAKIARAIWFNTSKRITFNEEYKVYQIRDESDNIFMVQLMPIATRSCVEKSNCCPY